MACRASFSESRHAPCPPECLLYDAVRLDKRQAAKSEVRGLRARLHGTPMTSGARGQGNLANGRICGEGDDKHSGEACNHDQRKEITNSHVGTHISQPVAGSR